jgi:SAM-dependent methyltransferase
MELADEWDRLAERWITLARSQGEDRDHIFWDFTLPQLEAILPPPPASLLDLGCGEGRLTRYLREKSYDVCAIDPSSRMIEAANEKDESGGYLIASATDLPFRDQDFDSVVSSMSLHDMEDIPLALKEIKRILKTTGSLCFAIPHPFYTFQKSDGPYYEERRIQVISSRDSDFVMESIHRPLSSYLNALSREGFIIDRVEEPTSVAETLEERRASWRVPFMLVVRAIKA